LVRDVHEADVVNSDVFERDPENLLVIYLWFAEAVNRDD